MIRREALPHRVDTRSVRVEAKLVGVPGDELVPGNLQHDLRMIELVDAVPEAHDTPVPRTACLVAVKLAVVEDVVRRTLPRQAEQL